MQPHYDIVIVGAGHAGAQVAISLRQLQFTGSIALVGDEPLPPYERPPLSKEYLAGEKEFERILLRPEKFWGERDIDLLTSCRVAQVDSIGHRITLSNDATIAYGKLVWATGGSPRPLTCAGSMAHNVFAVRRRSDVDQIMDMLPVVNHVAVIGGGYIGLEAAAVLTKLGKQVTVLEALDRVLSRVAGETLSRFYEEEHRAHGVDLRTDTMVKLLITDDSGKVTGVELDDRSIIATDMVIVGIGIIPETGPLISEGAAGGNGVDVDEHCRTSLPDVYAIGDCAAHANRFANGRQMRVESVQNANDQAKTVAQDIIGQPLAYDAVPWFWSNQYDLRLQTVGLSTDFDEEILRGDPASRSFSLIYRRAGRVIALDCVNMTKDYVQGRKLVLEGQLLDAGQLADASVPLKEVGLA